MSTLQNTIKAFCVPINLLARTLIVFALALFFACATKQPAPAPVLNEYVGMPSHEVETVLGPPDFVYLSKFGDLSEGGEWVGRVWVYFGEKDPRFQKVDRRTKDLFVFYPPEGEMKLNHWKLEVIPEPPDTSAGH